jgi:putative membrane protein
MSLLRQTYRLARLELLLVLSPAKWLVTVCVVAIIPALYLLIYLSSMWDPAAHTRSLRVGLVNQDKGYAYRDQMVDMGGELVNRLMRKADLGYLPLTSPETARDLVRSGDLAFAVIIPPDFSALAVPARMADEGRLEIYASAGNNYQTYLIAKKYAEELDAELNQALNEQRWKLVLTSSMASHDLFALKSALTEIQRGTLELNTGLQAAARNSGRMTQGVAQLGEEVNKLTTGTQQMGQFLRSMETVLPPADDVRRLRVGADDLAAAHGEFDKALGNLHAGSVRLTQGVEQFKQSQSGVPFFSSSLQEALDPLQTGLVDLREGLFKAQSGHRQLTSGAESMRDAVRTLAFGVRDLRAGLRQVLVKVPENPPLVQLGQSATDLALAQSQLDQGLRRLSDGGVFLQSSTQLLLNRMPTQVSLIDGSPEGLAHSVISELKVVSPVSHLGAAMVPNVIPVAMWLGAGIAVFLIRGRHIAGVARRYSSAAKLLGKAVVPTVVVGLQSVLLEGLLLLWFDLRVDHLLAWTGLIVCTAIAFVFVLLLFIRLAGDVGKALAMLLLALQISASGGVVPIELSSQFFAVLSPWLPMTWVVQGLKAAMFSAYAGNWMGPLIQTLALTLICALITMTIGRWHYCRLSRLRPMLDI